MGTLDDLFKEIKENARRDRKRLESVVEKIVSIDPAVMENEPVTAIAISENLSKAIDALTRSNAQLVELAKIEARRMETSDKGKNSENDSIYDEIEEENSDGESVE